MNVELNKSSEGGDGVLGGGEHLRLREQQVQTMGDKPEGCGANKLSAFKTGEGRGD